jgi:MarR-like DNA-binding transcriptional regulator SgrR of sgrS sRNA
VAVPTSFLGHYAHLEPNRLTSGEALFVLHLMEFKWDEDAPFPGYATLAQRMGISVKMARRHAQTLEAKKYLTRKIRVGRTNRFDLSPLFDALLNATQKEQKSETARRRGKQNTQDEIFQWMGRMVQASRKMSRKDQKALAAWEAENMND